MSKFKSIIVFFSFLIFPSFCFGADLQEWYTTGFDDYGTIADLNCKAQTWSTSTPDFTISSVKAYLTSASGAGICTLAMRSTLAGVPLSSDLCSTTFDGDSVSSATYEMFEVDLSSASCPTFISSTTYAIFIRCPSTSGGYLRWGGDWSSPLYERGIVFTSSDGGVIFTSPYTADSLFEIYGDPYVAPTSTPTTTSATTTFAVWFDESAIYLYGFLALILTLILLRFIILLGMSFVRIYKEKHI